MLMLKHRHTGLLLTVNSSSPAVCKTLPLGRSRAPVHDLTQADPISRSRQARQIGGTAESDDGNAEYQKENRLNQHDHRRQLVTAAELEYLVECR